MQRSACSTFVKDITKWYALACVQQAQQSPGMSNIHIIKQPIKNQPTCKCSLPKRRKQRTYAKYSIMHAHRHGITGAKASCHLGSQPLQADAWPLTARTAQVICIIVAALASCRVQLTPGPQRQGRRRLFLKYSLLSWSGAACSSRLALDNHHRAARVVCCSPQKQSMRHKPFGFR